jgi:hypothetical protein
VARKTLTTRRDAAAAAPGFYRKVKTHTWVDEKVLRLSRPMEPNAQQLLFYLLTGPITTPIPGLMEVGVMDLAERLRWSGRDVIPRTRACMGELEREGILRYDPAARLAWLPHAIAHNVPTSHTHVLSWRNIIAQLPDSPLKFEALATILVYFLQPSNFVAPSIPRALEEAFPPLKSLPRDGDGIPVGIPRWHPGVASRVPIGEGTRDGPGDALLLLQHSTARAPSSAPQPAPAPVEVSTAVGGEGDEIEESPSLFTPPTPAAIGLGTQGPELATTPTAPSAELEGLRWGDVRPPGAPLGMASPPPSARLGHDPFFRREEPEPPARPPLQLAGTTKKIIVKREKKKRSSYLVQAQADASESSAQELFEALRAVARRLGKAGGALAAPEGFAEWAAWVLGTYGQEVALKAYEAALCESGRHGLTCKGIRVFIQPGVCGERLEQAQIDLELEKSRELERLEQARDAYGEGYGEGTRDGSRDGTGDAGRDTTGDAIPSGMSDGTGDAGRDTTGDGAGDAIPAEPEPESRGAAEAATAQLMAAVLATGRTHWHEDLTCLRGDSLEAGELTLNVEKPGAAWVEMHYGKWLRQIAAELGFRLVLQ